MLDGSENFYAFEIVDKVKLVDSKYRILNTEIDILEINQDLSTTANSRIIAK